mgnify:CR=1 FL=1
MEIMVVGKIDSGVLGKRSDVRGSSLLAELGLVYGLFGLIRRIFSPPGLAKSSTMGKKHA